MIQSAVIDRAVIDRAVIRRAKHGVRGPRRVTQREFKRRRGARSALCSPARRAKTRCGALHALPPPVMAREVCLRGGAGHALLSRTPHARLSRAPPLVCTQGGRGVPSASLLSGGPRFSGGRGSQGGRGVPSASLLSQGARGVPSASVLSGGPRPRLRFWSHGARGMPRAPSNRMSTQMAPRERRACLFPQPAPPG